MDILISQWHPANNPLYKEAFKLFVTDYDCLMCKALKCADSKHIINKGIYFIIPWYLCIDHIPRKCKLKDLLIGMNNCNLDNRWASLKKKKIGLPMNKIELYKKCIDYTSVYKYKRKTPDIIVKQLKELQVGKLGKQNNNMLVEAQQKAIELFNEELGKIGNITGDNESFELYANKRFAEIFKEQVQRKKTPKNIQRLRNTVQYIKLALQMIELSLNWGKNVNMFPEMKLPPWNTSIDYLPEFSNFHLSMKQQCGDSSMSPDQIQDCKWIGGIDYPCLDNFCVKFFRKSNDNVFLLSNKESIDDDGDDYIVVRNYNLKVQKIIENLGLCGTPVSYTGDENAIGHLYKRQKKDLYYKVPNNKLMPLRDFFNMGMYEPDCKNLDLELSVRLKWILNIHFWGTVKPLLQFIKDRPIILTVDNVWYDFETLYVWGAKEGKQFPFKNFANVKDDEEEYLKKYILQ